MRIKEIGKMFLDYLNAAPVYSCVLGDSCDQEECVRKYTVDRKVMGMNVDGNEVTCPKKETLEQAAQMAFWELNKDSDEF